MLDVFDIPSSSKGDTQIFYANSLTAAGTAAREWVAWRKPRGARMAHIFALAGGGGGAGGFLGASNAAGGGGGGGSSAQLSFFMPLWLLPDVLYLSIGFGGKGGAASAAGSIGLPTYISAYPNFVSGHAQTLAIVNPGGGGNTGTATAGGAGGSAGASSTISVMPLLGPAIYTNNTGPSVVGQAGTAGGFRAVGGAQSIPSQSSRAMGGTGGGGIATAGATAGGLVTALSVTPSFFPNSTFVGGAAAPSATGNGGNGISGNMGNYVNNDFFYYGGTGGGSGGNTSGNGGNGGYGGFGAGGGGGGAARTGSTGSLGGNGGDGIVIIKCW